MKILCTTLFVSLFLNFALAQQDSLEQSFVPKTKADWASLSNQSREGIRVTNLDSEGVSGEYLNYDTRSSKDDYYIDVEFRQFQTTTTTKQKAKKVRKPKKRKRTHGRLAAYKPKRGLFANCPSF